MWAGGANGGGSNNTVNASTGSGSDGGSQANDIVPTGLSGKGFETRASSAVRRWGDLVRSVWWKS